MSCCDSEGHVYNHWNLWPYLVMFGLQRLVTSLDAKFWCHIIMRFGNLGGGGDILGHHLLQESLSEYIAKISLWLKSLYKLNFQIIFNLSPQHTQSVTFVITYQQTTIKQLFFPSRILIVFVNINPEVSSTSLIRVSLRNQPLGQHRRTWLRPSHPGYNSTSWYNQQKFTTTTTTTTITTTTTTTTTTTVLLLLLLLLAV
jgi:hypothetical protein